MKCTTSTINTNIPGTSTPVPKCLVPGTRYIAPGTYIYSYEWGEFGLGAWRRPPDPNPSPNPNWNAVG